METRLSRPNLRTQMWTSMRGSRWCTWWWSLYGTLLRMRRSRPNLKTVTRSSWGGPGSQNIYTWEMTPVGFNTTNPARQNCSTTTFGCQKWDQWRYWGDDRAWRDWGGGRDHSQGVTLILYLVHIVTCNLNSLTITSLKFLPSNFLINHGNISTSTFYSVF